MRDNAELSLPHAAQAEQSVLGAILLDGLKAMDACIRLRPEHFHLTSNREIFAACQQLLATQSILDYQALANRLGDRLQAVGGHAYLSNLVEGVFRGFDVTQRVEMILERWKRREGMKLCALFSSRFAAPDADSNDTLAALQADVLDIISASTEQDEPLVSAYSEAAFEDLMERGRSESTSGLSYGLASLDSWTGGMRPGQVTVVGARSGVGKSSLMKQAALANARNGIPVAMFSLEMSRAEMLEGIWAIVGGVEARKIVRPHLLNIVERETLRAACQQVKAWPLRIYDKAELDINQIVALARMNVRQYGAKLVLVDYAQSVEGEGKDERSRVQAVSRKLTKMAKSEGCSLMLLSQLRKMPHEQYSKVPTISDLRETGQLENDAHVVVLLHRPWDDDRCRIADEASIIVPKMRRGQTGALPAMFNPRNLCFEQVTTNERRPAV